MVQSERAEEHSPGGRQPAEPDPADNGLDEIDAASAASMDASDPPAFGGVTGVGSEAVQGDERVQRITARAHELWLEAGSPDGVALDFWLAAEREVDGTPSDHGPIG